MNKIDKYKIAAEIKKENPEMTHKEALEISKEVEIMYLDLNCNFNEAIAKAKEMVANENENIKKAN
ncbi:hypothetical protein RBU61_14230 [Tissierella sp. MB52-C2]|uniref:hypothetical protein n=1 Tax=Tissierella sp. MB52-C2 TaxID=3070999 RepID=UPI00280B6390|nr:hypothetical protein [Tissierella sp. MB52-C2]WMM24073.1 hypothetical protein RBU61_14230 [Tissierella sp. MB52-C2]